MPMYEFYCSDCDSHFEQQMTVRDHDKHEVECPKCHSKNVAQHIEQFFAVTAKKS
jgi:putative FmdB family regulatory protein